MQLRTATHLGLALAAMVGVSSVFNLGALQPAPPATAKPRSSARIRWPTPPTSTRSSARTSRTPSPSSPTTTRCRTRPGSRTSTFGDDVTYRINIDNNGDAVEDIFYQWDFDTEIVNPNSLLYNSGPIDSLDSPNLNVRQTYTLSEGRGGVLTEIASGLMTPPVNIGPKSTPDYEALARRPSSRSATASRSSPVSATIRSGSISAVSATCSPSASCPATPAAASTTWQASTSSRWPSRSRSSN